jgi:RNA polymerase sigma-70 factor (ECF subfamily)
VIGADDRVVTEAGTGQAVTKQDTRDRKAEFTSYLGGIQARLYGYIHSLIPDINDTDDLYQQTALVLWNKFGQFDRSRDFFAWACGVARGEVANYARHRARQRLYLAADINLLLVEAHAEFTDAERDDRRAALSHCVGKLPPADRDLLAECYREPDGVYAAADRRRRSTHSVYNSLRRIRKALYDCVSRNMAYRPGPGGM